MGHECACDLDVGNDMPTFYIEPTMCRAKKAHRCCECRGEIKPGTQYERACGVWEGKFKTFKTCIGCKRVRDHYFPHGHNFGEMRADLWECWQIDYLGEWEVE